MSKHIEINNYFISEQMQKGIIKLLYIPSHENTYSPNRFLKKKVSDFLNLNKMQFEFMGEC